MRFLALLPLLVSCVEVKGGALELAWRLYRTDGIACCPDEDPCQQSKTSDVLVRFAPIGQGMGLERLFRCNETQGVTRFDVPPGRYSITVEGVCAAGRSALGPGPVERDVREGEVVQLGAVALTVNSVDRCCVPSGPSVCS